jgi:hypothetical protein
LPTAVFPEGWQPSPDGLRAARIADETRLLVIDASGHLVEVASAQEITGFSWFPDSRYLAYSSRVPTGVAFPASEDQLWFADLMSATTSEIEKGFAPCVSPDGSRVAFMLGSRAGDACMVGFQLGVLSVDSEMRPVGLLRQEDIQGFPSSYQAETFYPVWGKKVGFPGVWLDSSALEVTMRWACIADDPGNGIYRIDLDEGVAEKVREIPAQ